MISFLPSEEQTLAKDMLDSLAREILRPQARPSDLGQTLTAAAREALGATGLLELACHPTEADEQPAVSNVMALEAIAYGDAAFATALGASLGHARAVMNLGSAAQQAALAKRWGSAPFPRAAVLIQEPGFTFDVTMPQCQVHRDGAQLLLNGIKSLVPDPSECTEFLVVAATPAGPAAFLVPANSPGILIGSSVGTLGLRSLKLAEVSFTDVVLPEDAQLGQASEGAVQRLIDSARTANSAIMTGVSRAVLDYLVPYLKDRHAHGSALARKQSVAFRLADMSIDIPSMRWMCWQAAAILDKGGDATRAARLAQIHCAEQARWITDEGVQLMGGHGYMRENPVERWYRDIRTLAGAEGIVGA